MVRGSWKSGIMSRDVGRLFKATNPDVWQTHWAVWICLVSPSEAVPVVCRQTLSLCDLNCCFSSLRRRPWQTKGWVNPACARSRHVPPVIGPSRTYLSARPLCSKCPLAQSACACEKGERGPIGAPVSNTLHKYDTLVAPFASIVTNQASAASEQLNTAVRNQWNSQQCQYVQVYCHISVETRGTKGGI